MSCSHEHSNGICDHSDADRGSEFSLNSQIDKLGIQGYNLVDASKAPLVFKNWESRFEVKDYIISDSDETILIYIPFVSSLKVKSISIMGENDSSAPSNMKVFINQDGLDFTTVESTTPTQSFELIRNLGAGMIPFYPTKITKFSNVRNMTIYISDNFGAETTRVNYIGLKGEWTPITRDPIIVDYESAANPADHKFPGVKSANTGFIQ